MHVPRDDRAYGCHWQLAASVSSAQARAGKLPVAPFKEVQMILETGIKANKASEPTLHA